MAIRDNLDKMLGVAATGAWAACAYAGTAATMAEPLTAVALGGMALVSGLRGNGQPGLADVIENAFTRIADHHRRHTAESGFSGNDINCAFEEFERHLPAIIPEPAVLVELGLDPGKVAAEFDKRLAAASARYAANGNARAILTEGFRQTYAIFAETPTAFARIEPLVAKRMLTDLGSIKADTTVILATTQGIAAAQGDTNAMLLEILARLPADRRGVPEATIIAIARRRADHVETVEQALAEIEQAIEIARDIAAQRARGTNLGDEVDAILKRLAALTAKGELDRASAEADRAIRDWEDRQAAMQVQGLALLDAGIEQDYLRRDAASVAAKLERRAALDLPVGGTLFEALRVVQDEWYERGRDKGLNLDLEVAIDLARRCGAHAAGRDERGAALNNLGNALAALGEREAGTALLEEAVAAFRAALEEWTRARVPLDWAMTQNNLGNALQTLGEREAGTARLEEAVVAFRAALEEWTRDRVPLQWAGTQNNLGNALWALGQRETGTARLDEAVTAYRAALEERTRARAPLQWATTQNNLGNALWALGQREAGTARLEEAVTAYSAALEEWTRDRVPLDWAMTQNNLGTALRTLGQREAGTVRLEEAVAAFRAALEERTRARAPLQWATTQNNLGNALQTLGQRETGTARLEEAVVAFRAALGERTRARAPLQWAMTQNNLGAALQTLGERETGTARLEEAVVAFRAALEEWTRDRVPLDWAMTQNNLGAALQTLGERETGTARLEEAVAAYRAALEEWSRARVPLQWAATQNNLGNALWALGQREAGTALLEEAVAAFRAALEEWTRARVPLDWAMTQNNLGNALQTLRQRETGTARLEDAVIAYRAALGERTRERVPFLWAQTRENRRSRHWRCSTAPATWRIATRRSRRSTRRLPSIATAGRPMTSAPPSICAA